MSSVATAAIVEVHVGDYYFTPQFADVQVGDTVRWIRDGGNHDVTSGAYCGDDSGLFYSPLTESNPVFEWTVPNGYDGDVIPYTCSVGNHCVAADQFGALLVNVEAHYLSTNGFSFEPSAITVNAGDAVFWIHGGGSHTVTSGTDCVPDGRFDQPLDNFHPLPFYVVPSDEPTGVIDYYCTPHCLMGMLGTISVEGVPTGACCYMNILCDEDMTEEECGGQWDPDYTWYEGMNCDEADCLAIGACCLPDGSGGFVCQEMVQESCMPDGEWMGWVNCDEVTCDQDCIGDLDGDGTIGVDDLLQMLSAYGVACGACPEDLDGSGVVDVDDLLQLLSVYGTDC
jgi:plastocyanin